MRYKNSKYLHPLALACAAGSTVREAAAALGCSDSFAYQLSRQDEFKALVSQYRSQSIQAAVGQLSGAAAKAAATLARLLDSNDEKVQLAAAGKLLQTLQPMLELHEMKQELDQLKQQLANQKPRVVA